MNNNTINNNNCKPVLKLYTKYNRFFIGVDTKNTISYTNLLRDCNIIPINYKKIADGVFMSEVSSVEYISILERRDELCSLITILELTK